jgi:hypothetical protein
MFKFKKSSTQMWGEFAGRMIMNTLIIFFLYKMSFDWLGGDRITFLTSCMLMLMLDRRFKK